MKREQTKDEAESALRELPSVIGACVREDVYGHPREIHLLVRHGPNPRHLAYDVRELLEERLGVPVDQRVISIAQLAPGRQPGPLLATRAGLAAAAEPVEEEPAAPAASVRVRFTGIRTDSADSRIRVRVSLDLDGVEQRGEASGLDTAAARLNAAAMATLQAVDAYCGGRARFQTEHVSVVSAFEREYVVVTALASSPFLGRRPISLAGAQPIDLDGESAAALAALKAVNRIFGLVLRLPADAGVRQVPRRR
ncbi:MAG TPA: hypothetical protein VK928_03600 [Longimicrobiales bacterium]|nr:hypothetical protein [Longimicrobiales bacterium]